MAYTSLLLLSCIGIGVGIIKPVRTVRTWSADNNDGQTDFKLIKENWQPRYSSLLTNEFTHTQKWDAPEIGVLEQSSADSDKWNFTSPDKWSDFAYADHDSVELVIGINKPQSNNYAQLMTLAAKYEGQLVKTVSIDTVVEAVLIDMPFEELSYFTAEVESAALSKYMEPNFKFHINIVPNDYYWSRQWAPAKIEADQAWNWQTGDPSILVAVIDTGVDYNHPDLATNYVPLGYDWVNNDADSNDDSGHGTHCAGILAGELNNGIGIAGMAQVRVMAEKAFDSHGIGGEVDLANAIIHAVDQGADILSNSWGGGSPSKLIHEAVKYAHNHGVLVVAAAGNDASDRKNYPAAYNEVIAVTATDSSDNPAWFTSYGDWVEVAAPGVLIYSTMSQTHEPQFNYPYDYVGGTSMATPHVAAVAALIWSQFPSMTRDEVRLKIRSTADDLGEPGFDVYYGYGRINARKAVEKAPPSHDLLIWSFETPLVLEPGKMALINTTILNFGENDGGNILVQLLVNGEFVGSKLIDFLGSGALATVAFSWNPIAEGTYNITSYVEPVPSETITRNNALSTLVLVKTSKVVKVPENYSSIQEAVDFADIGDVVQVAAGTYYESVSVAKSLSIIGESSGNTTINSNKTGAVIHIAADNVLVSGFTIESGTNGITLYHCVGNTLKDITALHVQRSLEVDGYTLPEFVHYIDTSNTVEGKTLYYLVNQQDLTINPSSFPDVGYLAIINSTNINVKSVNLTLEGPFLAYTTNSTIENVSISDSLIGMTLYRSSNNAIISNFLSNSHRGIDLTYSDNNVIYGNSIVNCPWSINLQEGCTANTIRENIIVGSKGTIGIDLSWSSDNALYDNLILNGEYGILLYSSGNNVLKGNDIIANYSFVIDGNTLSHFIQDIDTSNVVHGKPIYYLINQKNLTVEPSTFPNIGYLGIINSTNVVVRDLQLAGLSNYARIFFAFTEDSTVKNMTASESRFGVILTKSNNNKIMNSTFNDNQRGLLLTGSNDNDIMYNTVYDNQYGVYLYESDYNHICNNTLPFNEYNNIYLEASDHNHVNNNLCIHACGINIEYSSYNICWANEIKVHPYYEGVVLGWSSYNVISRNNISNFIYGVLVGFSSYNLISENDINGSENPQAIGIALLLVSNNNLICRNTISFCGYLGIWVFFGPNENMIHHNNFFDNWNSAEVTDKNTWDYGYPSGGNYWSDYTGVDLYSGVNQKEPGSDGIGDTPYVIDADNQDNYPLMNPHRPILGDLNDDGKVDMKDVGVAVVAYGSFPGHPRWTPIADMNLDSIVNMKDIGLICLNYGKTI